MNNYIIYYHGKQVGTQQADTPCQAINTFWEANIGFKMYDLTAFPVVIQ